MKGILEILALSIIVRLGQCIFVDTGNPYHEGPLRVGNLTISTTTDQSPVHTKAFFPLENGSYSVIIFIGGFNSMILAEFYETFLSKVASHGFYVFGLDFDYPIQSSAGEIYKRGFNRPGATGTRHILKLKSRAQLGDDADNVVKQIQWLTQFMANKTTSDIAWSDLGLMCHSGGCDTTLKMILKNHTQYKSTVFLEPMSFYAQKNTTFRLPAFMYGTQLSEEGPTRCAIQGFDWNQFYKIWQCPKIVIEVANFGHCDILDPVPWQVCHETHFCKTTNDTLLPQYRQFIQGAVSSFFIATIQNLPQDMLYISDSKNVPLSLLELKTDFSCSKN